MDKKQRIIELRKKHRDTVRFYADLINGLFLVEDNVYLPEELMLENCDILRELYSGKYIFSKDVGKIINLYERIIEGTKTPINMGILETYVDIIDRDCKKIPVCISCLLGLDENGLITDYVGRIRPLSQKEIDERMIVKAFTSDKNPKLFFQKIADFMSKDPNRLYAFIQFDIKNFRYINTKYGSSIGDEILSYISDTLGVMCDENHLFCRLNADIFQIVTYFNSRDEIQDYIGMLDARLHRYSNVRFNMSYGVSVAPGTSTEYRKHGDEAGLARIESKRVILKKAVFYEDTLMNNVRKHGDIEEIEEDALLNGEFYAYLQPKYSYNKNESRIIGAEALVRWIDMAGNFKSPADFIPVFEENGFILKLDQFMWEEVCKILRKWLDEGKTPVPISVNVSRTYLRKFDVVGFISNLLEKYDIPIDYFQLEITETTENADTIAYANAFKKAGFTLLMDDFGSGYSSLSLLRNTPFDVIKMDRLFLYECLDSEQGKSIVSHVISMSNDLGLSIVAEGVESKEVADFLYDHGCTISQGFYFSKPVSVEEFERICFGE